MKNLFKIALVALVFMAAGNSYSAVESVIGSNLQRDTLKNRETVKERHERKSQERKDRKASRERQREDIKNTSRAFNNAPRLR